MKGKLGETAERGTHKYDLIVIVVAEQHLDALLLARRDLRQLRNTAERAANAREDDRATAKSDACRCVRDARFIWASQFLVCGFGV